MTSIVFTQFDDDSPVDIYKAYYTQRYSKDTGFTILHKLCLFPEKLREYLANIKCQHEINLNIKTNYGYTPLMIAVLNDVIESVKLLLQSSALVDINTQNSFGYTALMFACENKKIKIVKLLLQHGADVNIQDNYVYKITALFCSCVDKNIKIAKLLLEYEADIDYNVTSLSNNIKIIKLLLNYGAYINNSYSTNISTTTNTILLNINDVSRKLTKFDYNSILLFEMKKCI